MFEDARSQLPLEKEVSKIARKISFRIQLLLAEKPPLPGSRLKKGFTKGKRIKKQ